MPGQRGGVCQIPNRPRKQRTLVPGRGCETESFTRRGKTAKYGHPQVEEEERSDSDEDDAQMQVAVAQGPGGSGCVGGNGGADPIRPRVTIESATKAFGTKVRTVGEPISL